MHSVPLSRAEDLNRRSTGSNPRCPRRWLGTTLPNVTKCEGLDADHEELTLQTRDSVALRARHSTRSGSKATVVVAHGFAAGCDDPAVRALVDELLEARFDIVTYDARGHGRSGGHCGVGSLEHIDVAAALSSIDMAALPIVLVGVSMGAIAVVAHLAGSTPEGSAAVVGAVLVSAPARWRVRPSAMALVNVLLTRSALGRWVAGRWLGVRIRPGWWPGETPESALARIGLPVAVVHGMSDRLLSTSHARRLHGSGIPTSRLNLVEGMGHGLDTIGRGAVLDAVEWVLTTAGSGHPVDVQPVSGGGA
jgi:pimeloyl-ACP methyl ester carboxylesterase